MDTDLTTRAVAGLRKQRLGAAGAFFVQGLIFISLTTRLPKIADKWDLTSVTLSLLLLMIVLLAGAGSVLAETVAHRRDSATVLRLGMAGIGIGLGLLSTAPQRWVFVLGLAIYGLALGLVDASSNMQAVALEHRYGRPILPSFHGAWTAGGILGTIIAIAAADLSLAASALPLLVLPALMLVAPLLPRDTGDPETAAVAHLDVPWRRIALLGLAMVLFYMVDTAATTWGPTYLDKTFDAPNRFVPLATLPYLVASLAARLAGDRSVGRFGPVPLLRAGGVVAAVALAIIVSAPTWGVAVLGFTILGGAVAVIAPLSFSAAAAVAGGDHDLATRQARVDAVIARFNQFNYLGALLGSVLTGLVGANTLRLGFAVPMVLILAIIPLARVFAIPRP